MYIYGGYPCKNCTSAMINAGIYEIIFIEDKPYDKYSPVLIEEANLKVRMYKKREIKWIKKEEFMFLL